MNFTLSETLLEKIRHRDEEAFRMLMQQTRSFAWESVYRLVRNREDTLDILQEAYIKVWNGIGGYDSASSFQAWFRRILRNQAIDWWRKHGQQLPDNIEGIEQTLSGDPDSHPDRLLERAEIEAWIRAGISVLPDTQRLVFMLRDLEGLTIEEAIQETGLTEASVKSNLYLARKRMAEEITFLRREAKGERRKKEIR